MPQLFSLRSDINRQKNSHRAKVSQSFFKTDKGEYGEGDIFVGLTVPEIRALAKKYNDLSFEDIEALLKSPIHEERLLAVIVLVINFEKGDERMRKKIFAFYLKNSKRVNNWDLVDLSADKIVGAHLFGRSTRLLDELARSENLWERRIAVIATFYFLKRGKYKPTLRLSRILLRDDHDLIHKAVGWMLREVGKRSLSDEEKFLSEHYKEMPRTMLRYAIEKFPERKRKRYLKN